MSEGIGANQYVWTDESGNVFGPDDTVEAGRSYYLSVAIQDNSSYDWDDT
ncbi:MAG: hypothetical protein LBQ58_01945 [Synergistaceae bacterium]|nr:hypothetical protein [Synergistaceae bacterium]